MWSKSINGALKCFLFVLIKHLVVEKNVRIARFDSIVEPLLTGRNRLESEGRKQWVLHLSCERFASHVVHNERARGFLSPVMALLQKNSFSFAPLERINPCRHYSLFVKKWAHTHHPNSFKQIRSILCARLKFSRFCARHHLNNSCWSEAFCFVSCFIKSIRNVWCSLLLENAFP